MKVFTFGLEKVLKLKKFHEEEARVELGRAVGVLSELESRLFILGQEQVRAQTAQFDPAHSVGEMQQYMFYLLRLDNDKEFLLKEITLAEMKVEQTREAFLEASRERKIMDELKKKHRMAYHKTMLAEETKDLDEISASSLLRLEKTA